MPELFIGRVKSNTSYPRNIFRYITLPMHPITRFCFSIINRNNNRANKIANTNFSPQQYSLNPSYGVTRAFFSWTYTRSSVLLRAGRKSEKNERNHTVNKSTYGCISGVHKLLAIWYEPTIEHKNYCTLIDLGLIQLLFCF